jgi:hypothetical protein
LNNDYEGDMKLGVFLSGLCQQPVGTDMVQDFKNIVTYAKKAQKLCLILNNFDRRVGN